MVKMKLLCSSALFGIVLMLHCAEGVFQPECDSLDGAIDSIQQSFAQINVIEGLGSATINCTKKPDCDGFTCILGFQSQKTEITVELKPCEDPPQMFVLMQNLDGTEPFVEETVTHGDSFPIPGIEYTYEFFRMQAALGVEFQNVSSGLSIGLSLDLYTNGRKLTSLPLLPPTVIAVPECTSAGADNQCMHMQTLVESLDPPHNFQCFKNPDCKGFNCTGAIQISGFNLYATAKVVILSCTNPVSYVISVGPPNSPPSDTVVFSYSKNVQLALEDLPGVTSDLNVTMIPYTQDIDYIRTTIEVVVCYPGIDCIRDVFVDNALVPIPPCDKPLPVPTSGSITPIPGNEDECLTMTDIAKDIQNNEFLEPDSMFCHHNGPCDGIECRINTSPDWYDISMTLLHCDDPVRILVVIKSSSGFNQERYVYNDDTLSINEIIDDSTLTFHMVKDESDEVELALILKIQASSPYGQSVYLIQNHTVPVGPCSSPTPTGNPSGNPTSATTLMTTEAMAPKTGPPKPKVTKKPNKETTKDPKNSKNDAKKVHNGQQSNSATIGIGIGIAALIAVVVIILVGVRYYRRNRTSTDHMSLVENSTAPI
ncbi:uncharacterized protein LOC117288052 [Asterias rubens]|uniref:uncharacterized protein LOC117288052 n=1 Tax=Asterias rubens TaxID=7604 RepID=UPI001454F69F|nr:uncharacterized protein LOC117288052 [Asterias rubens]